MKKILKHILFVLLIEITITSYALFEVYLSGSCYSYAYFFSYVFLILMLINTFYIKKNSGTGFVILVGFFSLLCFFLFPLLFIRIILFSDALGRTLSSLSIIIVILNIAYFVIQVCRKETKIHLVPYSIFLIVALIVMSLSHIYFYHLMCSQGT